MSDQLHLSTSEMARKSPDHADDEIDIGRLLTILFAGKWWITGCLAVVIGLAIVYLWITPQTYTADALLQIQATDSSPLSQMSAQAGGGLGTGAVSLLGLSQSTARSEIPIITSREVLGKTVHDLNLSTDAHPVYLPVVGGTFSDKSAKVDVGRFDVPEALFNEPFRLTVAGDQTYRLSGPDGEHFLDGRIGQAASGKTADGQNVELFVRSTSITSQASVAFTLTKKAWLTQVQSLRKQLRVEEVESGSGVLNLSLDGQDPEKTARIVNSVAEDYLAQNVEARSEQAAQSLEFLKGQLPRLKGKVTVAESKLAEYQESNQPVDLTAQSQALLTQVSSLEDKRSQLQLKVAELSQQYTSEYPPVQAARDQLAQLRRQSRDLQKNIDKLPNSQKQMLGLQRDVAVNTQLYTALLNRSQELQVAKLERSPMCASLIELSSLSRR